MAGMAMAPVSEEETPSTYARILNIL